MKKNGHAILIGISLAGILLCGCQTAPRNSASPPAQPPEKSARATWSNGYGLLYQLMTDEQNVSKLRYFKHEQPDVKDLVNRIAAAAGAAAKQLEAYDKEDGGVDLKNQDLPPGEQTTRDAIASTKKWDLLGHTRRTFRVEPAADAIGSDELRLASRGSGGQKRFNARNGRVTSRRLGGANEGFLSGNLRADAFADKNRAAGFFHRKIALG